MSMTGPSSPPPAPAGIAQCTGISRGTGARGCARCWRLTVTLGKPMRIARVSSSVTSTGSEAGNSMYIPPNSATKVTCWHSRSAGIALPPESGSTTMYCLIGSTERSCQRESAPAARRAASGSRRATSALSTRSTSPLEVDTRPGDRVNARGSAELTADLPGGSSPPTRALPHPRQGRGGFVHGLLDVDRGQPAAALEDAPVDPDRVHVRGLRRFHEHVRRLAEHPEIHLARVHHDEVGAFPGFQRPHALVHAHRAGAFDGRQLEHAARRELELVVGAAVLDVLDRFHDREHAGVARERRRIPRQPA